MFTTANLATMSKGALREACRNCNVSYTSLNNDAMRDALAPFASDYVAPLLDPANPPADLVEGASVVEVRDTVDMLHSHPSEGAAEVAAALVAALVPDSEHGANATPTVDTTSIALSIVPVFDANYIAGIAVPRDPAALFAATKPAKIEKVRKVRVPRDESNGVKRPAAGTLCGRVWSWCDTQCAEGVRPEAKALRAALSHIDPTTCTVQYYRWRKFNGISGR